LEQRIVAYNQESVLLVTEIQTKITENDKFEAENTSLKL
jgi:hypothetical protein